MKVAAIALFASFIASPSDAIGFRDLIKRTTRRPSRVESFADAVAADDADAVGTDNANADAKEDDARQLRAGCYGNSGSTPLAWHPTYSAGWTNGFCRFTQDCNSPPYSTLLACCKGAYAGQISGYCLSQLPNPPTTSPTEEGGLSVWYPDYFTAWPDAGCINTRPMPSGRPTYSTMLACCKAAYGGQVSGKCLSQLPNPPTTSPTTSGGIADFWYPDYDTAWTEAGCLNKFPLPYPNVNDRPNYKTNLACCKGAYGGQMSGKCLSQLPNPPTTSPTNSGGIADFWYPDYDTAWADAGCLNKFPLPYPNVNDRPNYKTNLACCKGAYGGQVSGACLSTLPSPPTSSPTTAGGLDVWYPDYDTSWAIAGCINDRPMPSGRPTYSTRLACCKGAYGGQVSGACLSELPNPPTTSPTSVGGLDVWYPDYATAWSVAGCINDRPLPSGRPTYSTMLACCKGAYGGQVSGACLSELPNPPTTSPTSSNGLTVWYPDYSLAWPSGICINDSPLPSGRPTYSSRLACCNAAYGGQTTYACHCDIDPCYSCTCSGATATGACPSLTCS